MPQYFKTVHSFPKDKATFAEVKKVENFENSRNCSRASTSSTSENVPLFSKSGKSKTFGNMFSGKILLAKCSKTGHKQADCKVTQCTFCKLFWSRLKLLLQKVSSTDAKMKHLNCEVFLLFLKSFRFATSETGLKMELLLKIQALPHICSVIGLFLQTFLTKLNAGSIMQNDRFSKVEGIGNVRGCLLDTEGKEHFVIFSDCLFLPDHAQNLISVSKLSQKGVKDEFGKESKMVAPNGRTFPIIKNENLCLLKAKFLEFCGTSGNTNSLLWHQRLSHNIMGEVEQLSSCFLGTSFQGSRFEKTCVCEICQISKSHKTPVYNNPQPRKSEKLELVFSDVWGRCPQLPWAVTVLLFFCRQF